MPKKIADAPNSLRQMRASAYTQEELTKKPHNFELEKCDSTVLCVDAYQSGIGSNSCGPALAEAYRVPREMHFACTFSVFRV